MKNRDIYMLVISVKCKDEYGCVGQKHWYSLNFPYLLIKISQYRIPSHVGAISPSLSFSLSQALSLFPMFPHTRIRLSFNVRHAVVHLLLWFSTKPRAMEGHCEP